jgi:hypothetical protein
MNTPHTNSNPNRYQINADDDRRLTGEDSAAYFAIATALDALEAQDGTGIYRETWTAMQPQARKALRSAENALRRAAWIIVIHAPEPK